MFPIATTKKANVSIDMALDMSTENYQFLQRTFCLHPEDEEQILLRKVGTYLTLRDTLPIFSPKLVHSKNDIKVEVTLLTCHGFVEKKYRYKSEVKRA